MTRGYSLSSVNRVQPRTSSFIQSVIPYPLTPLAPQDPLELRLAGLQSLMVPVNLDPGSLYMQQYIRFQVANESAGPALTGTISSVAGQNQFTGVGTNFTQTMQVGGVVWYINTTNQISYAVVSSIPSDTVFKTTSVQSGSATSIYGLMQSKNIPTSFGDLWPSDWIADVIPNTGTITLSTTANTLVGVGTLFTKELVIGDKIEVFADNGTPEWVVIASITSDTVATIQGFAPLTATARPYTRFYTRYSDISFNIYTAAGVWLGETNVQANQSAFGGNGIAKSTNGLIRRMYLYGRQDAIIVQIQNLSKDARRVHAHFLGLQIYP